MRTGRHERERCPDGRQTVATTDLDRIHVLLDLLSVACLVRGQIVMAGLLPLLRSLGPDIPRIVAVHFARVAWPCFGLAVVTGIWSLFAVVVADHDIGNLTALLVELSGVLAAIHATTRSVALNGLAPLRELFVGTILVT